MSSPERTVEEQDAFLSETIGRDETRLRNFIRRRVADAEEAEDMLQDVFKSWWQHTGWQNQFIKPRRGCFASRASCGRSVSKKRTFSLQNESGEDCTLEDLLPFKEMVERTGTSVNTLMSRKRYAVLHLRERSKDAYEGLEGVDGMKQARQGLRGILLTGWRWWYWDLPSKPCGTG